MTPDIIVWTHDDVNAHLARTWCDEYGLGFQLGDARDQLFATTAGAVVFDLNHLGLNRDEREQFVARLCSALLPYPAAVASYDFEPEDIAALSASGWLVFEHLGDELLRELATALGLESGDAAA
jgi:hypothetical protein